MISVVAEGEVGENDAEVRKSRRAGLSESCSVLKEERRVESVDETSWEGRNERTYGSVVSRDVEESPERVERVLVLVRKSLRGKEVQVSDGEGRMKANANRDEPPKSSLDE